MSTSEAGAPLGASGEQIRQREFATVRRGYDPDQVHVYLAALADHVDALERALIEARTRTAEAEAQLETAPPSADPYEQLSKRFAGVLASADAQAEEIVDQARDEAGRIKSEAQARAEELRMRSSRSLIAAQEESERMMANLAERREAMLGQLHEMQARLLSVADDLEVAIQPSAGEAEAEPVPTEASPPRPAQPPTVSGDSTPIEDLWVASEPPPPPGTDAPGPAFEPSAFEPSVPEDVDLPDLSGLDLDLDLDLDDDRGA